MKKCNCSGFALQYEGCLCGADDYNKTSIDLKREDAKLLRRILAVGTWDATNLSTDEENLIKRIIGEIQDYLTS